MKPEEMKHRREGLGLSQSAFAEALGVDVMTVSRWERGVYPIPKHIALAVEAIELRKERAA